LRAASSTKVRGINRVVYDKISKPPGMIEWGVSESFLPAKILDGGYAWEAA
jgi:GMP synthase C terminal domain